MRGEVEFIAIAVVVAGVVWWLKTKSRVNTEPSCITVRDGKKLMLSLLLSCLESVG